MTRLLVSLDHSFMFFCRSLPLLRICVVFFLMIRRPPRSTLDRSSAASDVYKRQFKYPLSGSYALKNIDLKIRKGSTLGIIGHTGSGTVSYTHLRAHETVLDLVCRLLLEKKKK